MTENEYTLAHVRKQFASGEAMLIDVREQAEWDDGHILGSQLVPLSSLSAGQEPDIPNKEKQLYLYCLSGNRVFTAKPILEDMGFAKITPLVEGFDELCDEGFPAEEDS